MSKNQTLVKEEKFIVPVDMEGNVNIDALPISDAEKKAAKNMNKVLWKQFARWVVFSALIDSIGILFFVLLLYKGYILIEFNLLGVLIVILGIFIIPCLISDNVIKMLKIPDGDRELFPEYCDSMMLCWQIRMMMKMKKTTWKGKERFVTTKLVFNCRYSSERIKDYYRDIILPTTNVSEEVKTAWLYQAKKSGVWKVV